MIGGVRVRGRQSAAATIVARWLKSFMNAKRLFLASIIWTVVMLGGGYLAAVRMAQQVAFDRNAEERAKSLGQTIGTVTGIGYGVIWIPYAYALGKKRRQEKSRPVKGKRRR